MALLFFDGFDHYGNNAHVADMGKWGQLIGSIAQTGTYAVRTGAYSLNLYYINDELITKPLPASGGFVVGMALFWAVSPAGSDIIHIKEGAVNHLGVAITAGGVLQVKVGTTVVAPGTTVLLPNSWHYIEFKGIISSVAGSYELRIDGTPEILNAGPVNTRNGGLTGQWDRMGILSVQSGWNSYVDDLYVCDQSGGPPRNTFLNAVRVETLYPQTDATAVGSNQGLTPSTGTDHGALVRETSPNITDYNSSAVVGAKDTYHYPPMTLTGTVIGIQTNLYAAKSDAGVRQVCGVVRVGGLDYDGVNIAPLTTFQYLNEVRPQTPLGADWTVADIAALQAGMKVTL